MSTPIMVRGPKSLSHVGHLMAGGLPLATVMGLCRCGMLSTVVTSILIAVMQTPILATLLLVLLSTTWPGHPMVRVLLLLAMMAPCKSGSPGGNALTWIGSKET